MQKSSIKSAGPGKPRSVPSVGSVSAVGPSGAAPKPRVKNTRDYGKPQADPEITAAVNPFGPSAVGGI